MLNVICYVLNTRQVPTWTKMNDCEILIILTLPIRPSGMVDVFTDYP